MTNFHTPETETAFAALWSAGMTFVQRYEAIKAILSPVNAAYTQSLDPVNKEQKIKAGETLSAAKGSLTQIVQRKITPEEMPARMAADNYFDPLGPSKGHTTLYQIFNEQAGYHTVTNVKRYPSLLSKENDIRLFVELVEASEEEVESLNVQTKVVDFCVDQMIVMIEKGKDQPALLALLQAFKQDNQRATQALKDFAKAVKPLLSACKV